MFSAQQTHSPMRATLERGLVECEKCRTPIVVNHPNMVAVEFSVPCSHCGHRGIYYKRMLSVDTGGRR